MKSNTVPWRNHIHAVGLGMAVSIGGLTPASAQTQVPISGLAPYLACTPDQIQKAQKATRLEKVTDIAHLVRQIHANLDKGVLCADPEWLEKQWGIRIFHWRLRRGLPEYQVHRDQDRQVEPPPLARYMVSHRSGPGEAGKVVSLIDVGFWGGQNHPGESFMPVQDLFSLLGPPNEQTRNNHDPAPPNPTQPVPPPMKRGGNLQRANLKWLRPQGIAIVATTGYQSEIGSVRFIQETAGVNK